MPHHERFRSIVETAVDGIVTIEANGTIASFNPAAERMFGYAAHEVVGENVTLLMPEPYRSEHGGYIERYLATGDPRIIGSGREVWARRRDGSTFPIHLAVGEMHLDDRRMFTGIVRDITAMKEAEAGLLAREERYRSVVETAVDGIVTIDASGVVASFNRAAERMFGYAAAEVVGQNVSMLMPEPYCGEHDGYLARYLRDGDPRIIGTGREAVARRKDGSTFPIDLAVGEMLVGGHRMFTGIVRDITRLKEADAALRADQARAAAVASLGRIALQHRDLAELLDGALTMLRQTLGADYASVLELSASGTELVVRSAAGWSGDVTGVRMPVAAAGLSAASLEAAGARVSDAGSSPELLQGAGGPVQPGVESGMSVAVRTHAGVFGVLGAFARAPLAFEEAHAHFLEAVANVLGGAIDRARGEDAIRHQATHDALTGIANRTLLLDRLGHALERGTRQGVPVAVIYIDLDHFKQINDTLGHEVGDSLLVLVTHRLAHTLRPGDTLARLGGDEFVVICEDVETADAAAIARRIVDCMAEPFRYGTNELHVSASIGLAIRHGGGDAGELIRDADTAMYRAKASGRRRFEVFDHAMRQRLLERHAVETGLRQAIAADGLVVHYQPIVSIASGELRGFEALVRWRRAEGDVVAPAAFIGVAEQVGLIRQIDLWVLRRACEDAALWNASAPDGRPLAVNVNISGRSLADDDFHLRARDILAEWDLPPGQIGLEITETVLLDQLEQHGRSLEALREFGVRICLDDFGTGYSSLSHLQHFPLDQLKLDRSFVRDLTTHDRNRSIVMAVVQLAQALGLEVVAEGVETEAELDVLRQMRCELAQGYYFARPAPRSATDLFVATLRVPPAGGA